MPRPRRTSTPEFIGNRRAIPSDRPRVGLMAHPVAERELVTMKALVTLVIGASVLCGGATRAAEAAAKPHILFCIADDASPHFGAYGCTWVKTPNIDRVAAAGVVFDNAYTPTAKCAPSRAAIMTGRYPWQLEAAANHQPFFPAKFKSFTEALSETGVYA